MRGRTLGLAGGGGGFRGGVRNGGFGLSGNGFIAWSVGRLRRAFISQGLDQAGLFHGGGLGAAAAPGAARSPSLNPSNFVVDPRGFCYNAATTAGMAFGLKKRFPSAFERSAPQC